jgi:GntR family transcriptional repressor for pyruvate dehydrogenase complex
MSFELQAIDRSRLYLSIVEQILQGVESGAFPPGSALPAERLLAARLEVSRGSVREAIRVLEHAGVLDVRTGSGTYVTEAGLSKAALLRAQAALTGEHSPLDVIAARRAVEPICAEIAAAQRHERDLVTIRETVARQAELGASGEDAAEVDLHFHLAIAGATHNPVLVLLVERLAEIMRRRAWSDLKQRTRLTPADAHRDVVEHTGVLDAVAAGDGPAARRAMRKHLSSVEQDLLAEIE